MEVHKALRLPRNLRMEVHKALCLPRNLHMEGHKVLRLPRNLHMEDHKVLCLPRNLHMEVHKVLCLPRNLHMEVHKALRLPRILHVNKQVNTLITMEGRTATTADNRRQPQTTQRPQPLTEHGGSQSAAPATNSGGVSVCVVTKCCACHVFCTWRFTKCCACHEFCASTNRWIL